MALFGAILPDGDLQELLLPLWAIVDCRGARSETCKKRRKSLRSARSEVIAGA